MPQQAEIVRQPVLNVQPTSWIATGVHVQIEHGLCKRVLVWWWLQTDSHLNFSSLFIRASLALLQSQYLFCKTDLFQHARGGPGYTTRVDTAVAVRCLPDVIHCTVR